MQMLITKEQKMKCTIPEISWHNRGPVLSVDVQMGTWKSSTGEKFWRLASGGADSHVLVSLFLFFDIVLIYYFTELLNYNQFNIVNKRSSK